MGYYFSKNYAQKQVNIIYDSPQYMVGCTALLALSQEEIRELLSTIRHVQETFDPVILDFPNALYQMNFFGALVRMSIPGGHLEEQYPLSLIQCMAEEYLKALQEMEKEL